LPPTVLPGGLPGRMVAEPGQPLLLWLHGGAFIVGSSASHWGMAAEALPPDVGLMLPDYALAPEQPFPAAVDQIIALLAALERAGFPAHHLAIGGDSAGGNLAVAAIQARLAAGHPAPAACWLISPYLDLTNGSDSIAARRHRDRFVNPDDGTNRRYAGTAPLDDPRLSPLFGPVAGFPETLVQVGSEEVLADDARRFARRLWDAGRPCAFQEWEGMMHVWPLFAPRLAEGRAALAQGAAFLRRIFQA
jgi:acetyl esterase/lipase